MLWYKVKHFLVDLYTALNKSKLKNKIFFNYVLIIVAAMVIVGLVNYARVKSVLVEEESQVLEEILVQVKANIEYKLDIVEEMSGAIAKNSIISTLVDFEPTSVSDIVTLYNEQIDPFFAAYDIGDSLSPIVFALYLDNEHIQYDGKYVKNLELYKDQPWFKQVSNSPNKIYWRNKFTEWDKSEYIASYQKINSPFYEGHKIYVEGKIPVSYLKQQFQQMDMKRIGVVYLFDENGSIILSSGEGEDELHGICLRDLKDKTGHQIVNVQGKENLLIYTSLENNWMILSIMPVETIYEKVRFIGYSTWMTIALGLLLAGMVMYLLSGVLAGRLNQLVIKIKKLNYPLDYSQGKHQDEISELNLGFDALIRKIDYLVQESHDLQQAKRKLQLDVLLEQIKPHFLYNTLSCIKYEAAKLGDKVIGQITDALIRFYRLNLNNGQQYIKVKDENEMVQQYCKIFKFNYEKDFNITYEMDEEIAECYMLKFIVQPVVENALIHGIFGMGKEGRIHICYKKQNTNIYISVEDNGRGMDQNTIDQLLNGEGKGYGLKNVMEGIRVYYGKEYGITINSKLDEGTKVQILIPIVDKPQTME